MRIEFKNELLPLPIIPNRRILSALTSVLVGLNPMNDPMKYSMTQSVFDHIGELSAGEQT